ncbi:phosphomannomutase/phosphoglucomutase [Caldithrix abyssi]|uniref:Phosphoglucomutase/phosphomannomutase alpha/beta/alpha domain II n=1 Tax=Caldithrix abyssi DSM 13497 TaxID=880073 RepID=H1XR12_CALAY|nr:phosphomannomutase/phosphoglucomutase [Caldithrix abyssi]APF20027.1 phosphomannomutase / phosphoglucomutase [Caldithrix abyssi DSM 13497]EHO40106.1 phosphoglucomutase/phosphomannomutase alpha/beta/alpha domain II [Caldithrix abyssi DSM 13497]
MISPYIFREYDIRGVVDKDLTEEVVELLGRGIGTYMVRHNARRITIGGDVRLSTEKLRKALMAGLRSTGVNVVDLGQVPTPVQYFSMHHIPDVQGGVMITGSHNPPEFNGFKITLHNAPVFGPMIQDIRTLIEKEDFEKGSGTYEKQEVIDDYINFIKQNVKLERPVKVVLDSGNGAASLVAHRLFKELGADTIDLFDTPDGRFPNHHPDPTVVKYIQELIKTTQESDAELGIGYDGDADRIGVIDENGDIIWGDRLMIIFSRDILKDNPGAPIIFDVKCSQALPEMIEKFGGKPVMSKTGHSNIKQKMKDLKAPFAGEMSGHLFFADRFFGFDDAIYASVRMVELVSRSHQKVSEFLSDVPKYYSTPEIRAEVENDEIKFNMAAKAKAYFSQNYEVIDIDGVRIQFGDGWGLVRASNTQPVLVMRFEARTPERLQEIQKMVIDKLKEFGEIKL